MKLSKRTIRKLAEMICGAHGTDNGFKWKNFIYRTGPELTEFFQDDCDLPYEHSGTRVTWVIDVLTELNDGEVKDPKFPADNITCVIFKLLESIKSEQLNTHQGAIEDIDAILNDNGLEIHYNEGNYTFVAKNKKTNSPLVTFITDENEFSINENIQFKQQFPVGLPFGWSAKPDFAVLAEKEGQRLGYELKNGLWILQAQYKIYPNFTFRQLENICNITHNANKQLKISLVNMNQTEREKRFFKAYGRKFKMADKEVPLLIPQAWIQWHSKTKRELKRTKSIHAEEPYRIDFVAFWNNKRYAIFVDDIGHYAKKNKAGVWIADEEQYSKQLKEERKLRNEGWLVFRVSNWEIDHDNLLQDILCDLKAFIGFDIEKIRAFDR